MDEFVYRLLRKTTVLRIFQTPLVESRGNVLSLKQKQRRCAVTAQLICAFVLAYAERRFSHDVALRTIRERRMESFVVFVYFCFLCQLVYWFYYSLM